MGKVKKRFFWGTGFENQKGNISGIGSISKKFLIETGQIVVSNQLIFRQFFSPQNPV